MLQDSRPFYRNAAQLPQSRVHPWQPVAHNLKPVQENLVFNYPNQGVAPGPPVIAPLLPRSPAYLGQGPSAPAPTHRIGLHQLQRCEHDCYLALHVLCQLH